MFRRTVLSTAVAVALGSSFVSSAAYSNEDSVEKLEKIQVTGSRISRVDVEGPSPVVVISAEDIESRGYTDIFEALNSLNQNTGGSLNQQNSFSFTPTAQAVNLRGLGVGRSLILIDGKRLPMFPLGAGGAENFTDIGQIPIAAVERIEVLTDGASAIYGSDAMSGVVNVILKKDYEGAEVKLRTGDAHEGGYQNNRLEVLAGTAGERSRVTFIAQFQNNEMLRNADRDWANNDDSDRSQFSAYSSYGASFQAADKTVTIPADCEGLLGKNAVLRSDGKCGYNRSAHRTLKPENESFDLMANFEYDLSDDMTAFSRLRFGQKETLAYFEPNAYDVELSATDPGNPTFGTPGAQKGEFTRRMVEFGERSSGGESQYLGAMAGVNGLFNDQYDWETTIGYTIQTMDVTSEEIIQKTIDDMVKAGTLNLLEEIPQSVVDAARGTSKIDSESSIISWTGSFSGDLMELPSGTAAFATFAEINRTEYEDVRDQGTLDGIYVGKGGTSGGGERTQYGVGGEVMVPVVEDLEVTLAGRFDDYNDDSKTGSAFTPKASFAYRPADVLMVRGGVGKSFRAPDMQRLFGGTTKGFNNSSDPTYCEATKSSGGTPAEIVEACGTQYFDTEVGANKELEEEKGTNYSFGIVWEAMDDLTVTADWYKVKLTDLVVTPDLGRIIADPSRYAGTQVIRKGDGTIDKVIYGPVNQAGENVEGIDLSVRYQFPETSFGLFSTEFATTYLIKRETQTSDTDPMKDVTDHEPGIQASVNLGWEYDKLSSNLFVKYRDSYCSEFANDYYFTDCEAAKSAGYETKVSSMTTFNLSAKYRVNEQAVVGMGITNLFDKTPPADPLDGTSPYYAETYDNPVGRAYYLEASYKF